MNANKTSKLISTIQILVSAALTLLIALGFFLTIRAGSLYALGLLLGIYPEIALILGTFIPVLVLRIKHRSQAAEGHLLPLFLLMVSLQTTRMLPNIVSFSGIYFLSNTWIVIMERFFFMSSYTVLLFAAIQNMKNVNTTKNGVNVLFSLIAVFVISYIIPINSGQQSIYHETIFNLLVFIIMLAGVATYMVSFISDRETYHLKRFFTFLFISAGDYMIMVGDRDILVSAIGTVFFIIGAVMLSTVSPQGY